MVVRSTGPEGVRSRGVQTQEVRRHFDLVAEDYDRWKRKAHLYYQAVKDAVAEVVPPGRRVLEVGCGTGDVLASLAPAEGVGVDLSEEMVRRARLRHPDLHFEVLDITLDVLPRRFEHAVAIDVMEHVGNVTGALQSMATMLSPGGTAVVVTANPTWAPVLGLAERLHLKMPEGDHHWRSVRELTAAAADAGLAVRSFDRLLLVPKQVPGLVALNTAGWAAGLRSRLGLVQRLVLQHQA